MFRKYKLLDILSCLVCLTVLVHCLREFAVIYFTGNEAEVMNRVFEFSGAIEAFILLQGTYMLFSRTASIRWIALFMALSIGLEEFLFFEEVFPRGLQSLGLGHLFVNHQEPRSFLFVLVFLFHLIFMFLPGKRSFERIFTILMLGATLGTSLLFHKNLISGALRDQEKVYTQMFSDFRIQEPEMFKSVCHLGKYNCLVIRDNRIVEQTGEDTININPYLLSKHFVGLQYDEHSTSGLFNTPFTMQNYFVHMKKHGDKIYAIYDKLNFHSYKRWLIIYFFRINIAAHYFWAFFTIFLIYFHRRLKVSPRLQEFFVPKYK